MFACVCDNVDCGVEGGKLMSLKMGKGLDRS